MLLVDQYFRKLSNLDKQEWILEFRERDPIGFKKWSNEYIICSCGFELKRKNKSRHITKNLHKLKLAEILLINKNKNNLNFFPS
jgi:hypothetical protein